MFTGVANGKTAENLNSTQMAGQLSYHIGIHKFEDVADFGLIVEEVREDRYVMGTSTNKSDPQPIVSITDNKNSTNDSLSSMNHTFSTDLLNEILFAEQSFRSELSFLLDRLSSERPKTESGGAALMNVNPILFSLEVNSWICNREYLKRRGCALASGALASASTPTSTAIRFTVDNPHGMLTNRLISATNAERTTMKLETTSSPRGEAVDKFDRLFGRAKVQLNGKLGQLYKSALYEETHEEFEEYANFMTQISVQNEEAITKDSLHSYLITLNRPFLLIKSNAVDKAILLWLNWREERSKLLVNRYCDKKKRDIKATSETKLTREAKLKPQEQQKSPLMSSRDKSPSTAPSNFATDMNINLSLSIQNGLYVCMPLYSAELNDNMAALVLSLQKSDVTVCVKKELACNASFNAFKVTFIENFDEQSLSEPWLHENTGDGGDSRSSFFFFPTGSYKFCTSATSPTAHNQNAKWILSVKSHMQGMVIDFDYVEKGKLTSLLIHTLSQFASDDEGVDDYAPSDISFACGAIHGRTTSHNVLSHQPILSVQSSFDQPLDHNHLQFGQLGEPTQDVLPGLAENDEFNKVVGHENKIRIIVSSSQYNQMNANGSNPISITQSNPQQPPPQPGSITRTTRSSARLAQSQLNSQDNNGGAQIGSQNVIRKADTKVQSIELTNFMGHSSLKLEFDTSKHNCFYIVGANGCDKSAMFTALNIGLGGKGRANGRGITLQEYIMDGQDSATIRIVLDNCGVPFPNFGDQIIVERSITRTSSTFVLKTRNTPGDDEKVVFCKQKPAFKSVLRHFNIELDNPLSWLCDEHARQFVQEVKPEKLNEIISSLIPPGSTTEQTVSVATKQSNIIDPITNLKNTATPNALPMTKSEPLENVSTVPEELRLQAPLNLFPPIDTDTNESELEKKLNDPDVNLSTILEDMHCFQEIRNSNEALLNYLKKEKVFRELFDTVLRPKPLEDDTFRKDSYKLVHQCTEAICLAPREFFKELVKYDDLVRMLVDFLELQSGQLNHLTVTFYSKLIMSFLNAETEAFLPKLEESNFLENCLSNLEFGVMFELICSIGNCSPDPAIKERIKKWYSNKRIADTLLNLLTTDHPSEKHENAAKIWAELIKASREIQYNVEITADPMLDALQNAECLERLLDHMFPDDMNFCPSIVASGCLIFNTLLETDSKLTLDQLFENQQGHYNSTPDQALSTSIEEGFPLDAHRVVETICAKRSSNIVKAVLKCLEQPPDAFYGDAFKGCMQLLVNLVNTNFRPTHLELLKTFASKETHLDKLFYAVAENPKRSIFNTQLTNLVLYVLYSSTGSQKQLMDFLIKDLNLPRVIRDAVGSSDVEDKSVSLLERVAKRSFFLNLANRLIQCQNSADHVDIAIKELPDYDEWNQFFNKTLEESSIDQSKSDYFSNLSKTRASCNIEIDEIKDIPFCLDSSNDDFRAPRLDGSPSTNLATQYTSVDEVHSNVVQIVGEETWPGQDGKSDFPAEQSFSVDETFLCGGLSSDEDEEATSLDSSNGSPTRKLFEALTPETVSSFGDIQARPNDHHGSKLATDADQCTTSKAVEETGIHDDEV
ncbi:SIT4 phosphatase-associated protein [Ditylenchus destructor]|nr:SIT4 phosphatase-associated protein [Ditylenchus destructor]